MVTGFDLVLLGFSVVILVKPIGLLNLSYLLGISTSFTGFFYFYMVLTIVNGFYLVLLGFLLPS